MVTAKDLFETLSAIPENQREHIYIYATSKDITIAVVKSAEYDEHATCSGGVMITL